MNIPSRHRPQAYLIALAALLLPRPPASAASGPDHPPPPAASAARLEPSYSFPYDPMPAAEIVERLQRVHRYLAASTPARLVDRKTGEPVVSPETKAAEDLALDRGDFQIVTYEWGVTYAGMLHAAEATGDRRYRDYVETRLRFIADHAPQFREAVAGWPANRELGRLPFRSVNRPHSLDDSGAMAAAFLKASRAGIEPVRFRPYIDRYLSWITEGQLRLDDGTLARNRPLPRALWLDDLYMSVPALAQMGALTGETRYFDDAARQLLQFHQRMFIKEKGLFLHGWIEGMEPHPAFAWARANGWAILAAVELLSVLPEDHPRRPAVLQLYREHARGLAAHQGGAGLWHQLLDRTDSYPETSASAMFVYALARGINRGWLDRLAYGPAVSLGWNAVAAQINPQGQVENTCVGTGMGFDPAFYYHRPVSVYAAHGYGPVLHAGAEMLTLRREKGAEALVSDGAVQFMPSPSRW